MRLLASIGALLVVAIGVGCISAPQSVPDVGAPFPIPTASLLSSTAQPTGTPAPQASPMLSSSALPTRALPLMAQVGGAARAVLVRNSVLYVGVGPRVLIFTIGNPNQPRLLGQSEVLPDTVQDIAATGDYLHVASGRAGLQILDVVDPSKPRLVGSYVAALEVTSVVIEGTNAYIGESRCHQGSCSGALQVLSVVDPAHPRPTRTVEVKGYVNKLIADSGRLYVAARAGGLRVIDIADPSSPHEVGAFATASEAWSVSVAPWKAYVATGSGLAVIDISDPTSPQLVGVSTVAPLPMRAVAAESGNLYTVDVLCDAGSCAWNLRAFSQAALPASPAIGSIGGSGMALGVAVADGVAYLATDSTLLAIDLHNPARPSQIAQVATTGPIGTIAASDHYAYAINTDHSDSALQVLDISNPSNPRGVNQTLVPGVAGKMVISGKHLYVAAWAAGLRVFDLSNASAPHEVGVFRAATMARGVDVVQGLAYVADGETGLRIIDVSEPTRLRQVGAYPDRSVWDAHAAAVVGGYAYVAARENGLRVIDISDPSQPSEAGFVYTSKRADRVATQNGYAYVATAQCQYSECSGGVVVIDARDPASPRQTSALDVEGGAFDIQVKGKYLIVASGDAGLQVFDISNPDALLPLARFQTPGKTSQVEMVGDLTFVAAQDAGMLVLRLPLGRP